MATVLTIGDTHCPGMKRGYVDFLKRVADEYQPDRIVHIGDLVDWHSISYHESNLSLPGPVAERKRAQRQVDRLSKAFPEADWLIGNHDALPHRKAQTSGLPDDVIVDPATYWGVDWTVHPRFGRFTIDGVEYSHGENGPQGQYAALNQCKSRFRSVVIGHLHANACCEWYANGEFRIFGLSVGCGIDVEKMQFEYGHKFVRKPILGCGVVIDGKRAFFEPWLLKSR